MAITKSGQVTAIEKIMLSRGKGKLNNAARKPSTSPTSGLIEYQKRECAGTMDDE